MKTVKKGGHMKKFQKLQELDRHLQRLRRNGIYKRTKTDLRDAYIMIIFYISFSSQYKGVRTTDIAKALNVTISAVTHNVKDLIKQGYLEKKRSEDDLRVYFLELLPKGKEYVERIRDDYYAPIKKVVKNLGEKDVVTFIRLLKKANKGGKFI